MDEEGEPIMESVYCLGDGTGRFVLSQQGGLIEVDDISEALPIGVFDYSKYNGMEQVLDTGYLPVDKNGDLWLGTGKPVQGYLERSNADLAEELTKVIDSQRAYGMALKMLQTSDEIEIKALYTVSSVPSLVLSKVLFAQSLLISASEKASP